MPSRPGRWTSAIPSSFVVVVRSPIRTVAPETFAPLSVRTGTAIVPFGGACDGREGTANGE
nr:hypothetical protein [Haladaptatus sp. R4]